MDKCQIESICNYWSSIDLTKLKREFDTVASDLTSRQDESELSRRKLVEMSREFKKNLSQDSMDTIVPLIKSFQSEIDSLLRRSKMAEAAFLTVYRQFIDLQDPHPVLQQLQHTTTTTTTSSKLNHEDSKYTNNNEIQYSNNPATLAACDKQSSSGSDTSTAEQTAAAELAANASDVGASPAVVDSDGNSRSSTTAPDTCLTLLQRLREAEHKVQSLTEELNERRSSQFSELRQNNQDLTHGNFAVQSVINHTIPVMPIYMQLLEAIDLKLRHLNNYSEIKELIGSVLYVPMTKNACQFGVMFESEQLVAEDLSKRSTQAPATSQSDIQQSSSYQLVQRTSSSPHAEMTSLDDARHDEVKHNGFTNCVPVQFSQPTAVHQTNAKSRKKHGSSQANSNNLSVRLAGDEFRTEMVLDTADVAQQVREILSVNNIGQRLFARHVLGLSQGTVSELLSKPKHWDKLTEKGRESYRRMHQWVCDGGNIAALKAYAPKKGNNVVVTGSDQDSAATEERISQILSEAQAAMMKKQSSEQVESAGSLVACIYQQELARMQHQQQQQQFEPDTSVSNTTNNSSTTNNSTNISSSNRSLTSSAHRRRNDLAKHRKQINNNSSSGSSNSSQPQQQPATSTDVTSDSLTHDIVARIYREELSKLADAAEASGNVDELTVYRRELERLKCADSARVNSDSRSEWLQKAETDGGKFGGHRDIIKADNGSGPMSVSDTMSPLKCERSRSSSSSSSPTASMSSLDANSDQPQDLRSVKKELSPTRQSVSPLLLATTFNKLYSGGQLSDPSSSTESVRRAGSAFSLVQPRCGSLSGTTVDGGGTPSPPVSVGETAPGSMMLSPLQQMQSIANLLLPKQTQQRPLRAVLPPISQEQIDRYSEINTDDLVRRVKDALSQYSISQRLFGETVLGLSQGSVSDLLARPKPWHLLTQKGREPFIRMQMFLEDEAAVSRLVASQYQIPADKFLRTGVSTSAAAAAAVAAINYPINCVTPSTVTSDDLRGGVAGLYPSPPSPAPAVAAADTAKSSPISTPTMIDGHRSTSLTLTNHSIENAFLDNKLGADLPKLQTTISPITLSQWPPQPNAGPLPIPPTIMMMPPFFPLTPATFFPPSAAATMFMDLQQRYAACGGGTGNAVAANDTGVSSPSAAVASSQSTPLLDSAEMDTLEITTQVKEVLQFHNLGQKLFGEAVLGLSQGSVSELLSKPKPWRVLSIKGREPFVKMAAWLADPSNISRLRMQQDQVKARSKRRGSGGTLDDSQDLSNEGCCQPTAIQPPANKKPRVFFTDEQKAALRAAYSHDTYPNQQTLDRLAAELRVGTKTVINWFHNHRMRAKQHHQQQHQQQQQPIDENYLPQSDNSTDRQQAEPDCHVTVDDDTPVMSSDDDDDVEMSNDDAAVDSDVVLSDNCMLTPTIRAKTTTSASAEDDSMTSVDVNVTTKDDAIVAKQQQQGNWANNRRRKNSRPQWHYEGTVLDKSQRADITETSAPAAAAASPGSTSAETTSERSASQIDGVSLPLLIGDSAGSDDVAENINKKATGHHDFTKTDIKSELVVAAGCDGWR